MMTTAKRPIRGLATVWCAGLIVLLVAAVLLPAGSASALLLIDFEQPYYVHPGWQVWDFCLIHTDGVYQIFYGAIPMDNPNPAASDHIWRSTSEDLIYWSEPEQVMEISDAAYESRALWAPDVVFDPGTQVWWMAYTGVGEGNNQRIGIAYSADLTTWNKSPLNPIQEPGPPTFFYDPEGQWSECRDPFLYRDNGQWHMLTTVQTPAPAGSRAALAVASASTMHSWSDPEVFLLSGSSTPAASLESSQYLVRDGIHHIFLHETGTVGVSHFAADELGGWDFATRRIIDFGLAPEVDTFDDGASWLYSRVAPYSEPHLDQLAFVVRIDTLAFADGLEMPEAVRTLPLARHFREFVGNSVLGNPTFGDNPVRRGEPSVGHVGQCYFGSGEYFQGPLSGRGQPGQALGNTATGTLDSHPFTVAGNSISLLVGGSDQPELCYVALIDAATDTIVHRESGAGLATMTERWWDTAPLLGREAYIRIVDASYDGHINVDHIQETMIALAVPESAAPFGGLVDLGPRPNPGNPQVTLRFESAVAVGGHVAIYDLRGRLVWRSAMRRLVAGANTVVWPGSGRSGQRAPGGVYVYRIVTEAGAAVSGKVTLAP